MKEECVTYDQAVKLKELGFDGNGLKNYIRQGYYKFANGYISPIKHDGDGILVQFRKEDAERIPAPRLDQAQAWLRDKGIHISVNPYMGYDVGADGALYNEYPSWGFELMDVASADFMDDAGGNHTSYELALSAGIDAALELLTLNTK